MECANPASSKLFDAQLGQPLRNLPPGQDNATHQSQTPARSGNDSSPQSRANGTNQNTSWVPRPKRIACVICRKRKLRCDGNKPSCGTCSRLGHDCAYDEVRKKSGPKRGYVKQLEARLAQVETLLKSQDSGEILQKSPVPTDTTPQPPTSGGLTNDLTDIFASSSGIENAHPVPVDPFGDLNPSQINLPDNNITSGGDFSWEMIGLGLEEPLPTQDAIDELNDIYFRKIHPVMPIIHKPRYYAAMNLAPSMRPPVCLRYIMWSLASSVSDKYQTLHPHFYQRARKYAELDQMSGLGESMITVAHSQTWILMSCYEFKMLFFPRAWISTGHAMRLALMMGLHRLDGDGPAVKTCIQPARDWTEQEERRRTFWVVFCQDRYASVGTGWPMMVDERDILTNLPASEEAFINSKIQQTYTLSSVMAGENISTLSALAAVVLLACFFGRNLHHLHRTTSEDKDHDLNGGFWKRHRALDNILLNTSLALPSHLRLPESINDSNIIFVNLCIHASTICLHQAAIFKAEINDMPSQIAAEGKRRSIVAADQITNILKMASHTDLTILNPFVAFCLYVACRVFLRHLKCRPDDGSSHSSLQFLLAAMNVLKRKNPLTESFLMQLDADLEGIGLGDKPGQPKFSCGIQYDERTLRTSEYRESLKATFQQVARQPQENIPSSSSNEHISVSLSSLPNRPKSPASSAPTVGNDTLTDVANAGSFSVPTDEIVIKSMIMDMDVSEASTTSDRQYLSSDYPTPRTNQSSNCSISPRNMDQPSPPVQPHHQRQPPQRPNPNIYVTGLPASQFEANFDNSTQAAFANYFTPGNPLPNAPGIENAFAFPAGWDTSSNQPREQFSASASAGPVDQLPNLDNMAWPIGADALSWKDYRD